MPEVIKNNLIPIGIIIALLIFVVIRAIILYRRNRISNIDLTKRELTDEGVKMYDTLEEQITQAQRSKSIIDEAHKRAASSTGFINTEADRGFTNELTADEAIFIEQYYSEMNPNHPS